MLVGVGCQATCGGSNQTQRGFYNEEKQALFHSQQTETNNLQEEKLFFSQTVYLSYSLIQCIFIDEN